MKELLHVWHPLTGCRHTMHQSWHANRSESCFYFGAPLLCTVGENGQNGRTVALSDPLTPLSVRFCIEDLEQKNRVSYEAVLFDGDSEEIERYETLLRIDSRTVPFSDAAQEVYEWWACEGFSIPIPPEAAEDAVYSTWYNFHQEPRESELLDELKIASELGFRTVILDDGWQIEGKSCGDYANCGAWQVSSDRFEDFKRFCEKVHRLGMKLMVWFAVPFVGVDSPFYERFRGYYLREADKNQRHGILDPRYPKVRAYIRENYERFLLDYDIDGFKLDYVDAFAVGGEIPAYDPEKMDSETVSEAVLRLLREIRDSLGAIKGGLLYEYRQRYVGPAINGFGNMLRVGDCAYDAHINRVELVNLRLFGYPTAVHSDMLFWSSKEALSLCARQLLNVLFAVPQISVRLSEGTEEQRALLKAYLTYWYANRDRILHGRFRAEYPEQNFTRLTSEDDKGSIAVLYGDLSYTYDGRPVSLHHGGNREGLLFENPTDTALTACLYTAFGGGSLGTCQIPPHTAIRLPIPPMGMAEISE
jgi:alpha-galactosidase